METKINESDRFPKGLAKPAIRALESAGITRLEQAAKRTKADLSKLHGMGPNAIRILHEALEAEGMSFK